MAEQFKFDASDKTVKDVLFSTYKYRIPRYQRPYAWGEDQVSEFWNDLISNGEPYFIGSLIFNLEHFKKDGFLDIIDGQQRILTITIFIAVLRDIVRGIDKKTAIRYQEQDIAFEDRAGKETYRIEPGDSTKAFFQKNIQITNSKIMDLANKDLKKEETKIKKAYEYFHQKVIDELKKFDAKEKKLAFLNDLRERVASLIVIRIDIENEEEAYEIFETTNARGVDLSVADLLKNLIFKNIRARKAKDDAKEIWKDITNNIQATNTEMKKFIRYFWISKYKFVQEKKLFKEIKKEIIDWNELLEDLWEESDRYNKLLEGNEDDFKALKNGHKIYKSIFSLRLMGVSQCQVLFLSILRNIKKLGTGSTKIFELIEKFTFQYSVVCKLPGNKVEKIYSKYAIRIEEVIRENTTKKIPAKIQSLFAKLKKELKEQCPLSEPFKESFMALAYRNSEKNRMLMKYVLSEINDNYRKTKEQKPDFNYVNIEHLLPQKPDKAWKLKGKDIKGYVNKLGNLTLLDRGINSVVQNKIIKEKIKDLKKSELPITKLLVKELEKGKNKWDEKQILKRQESFASLAYDKIWNI